MEDSLYGPFRPWHLMTAVSVLCLSVLVNLCIYRLFFHPYAKYPGPILAKLTSGYSLYHAYIGDMHIDIWKCHETYGDIVRYGPNRLIINTEEGLKGIYGHGKNVHKSKAYSKISLVPNSYSVLSTLDNAQHGKLRRILNQGLSDSHIRSVDSDLSHLASLFATRMGEPRDRFEPGPVYDDDGWTAPKNMADWADFYTFDVMSQFTFGTTYGMLSRPDDHWVIAGVKGAVRRVGLILQLPEIEDLRLDKVLFPDAKREAGRFARKSREIMEASKARAEENGGKKEPETIKRAAAEDGSVDLFSKLLTAKDHETGEGLSHTQLWSESILLILAGSDTSSTAIAAIFFYLSRYPAAYARVASEVRTKFSSEEIRQGPNLQSCVYLRACVQEAIRLVPSAPGPMWRQALDGGLSIPGPRGNSISVPAGCEVATANFAINRNERYYPEPSVFRPERWIPGEAGEEDLARAKAAFSSFSHGPRNCPGRSFAMTEIMLAVAAVLRVYDFRRADERSGLGSVGEGTGAFAGQYLAQWGFTAVASGPYIQFRPV